MNQRNDKPLVLSSPAPEHEDAEDAAADELTPEQLRRDADADALFQTYAAWCRTRGFYGPPPVNGSLLGKLSSKTSVRPMEGGPDAACSAELSAMHLAVIAQPAESLDRKVFTLHYLYNVRSVKAAAHALGVSRNHWYRLLRAFRERVLSSTKAIMADNTEARARLPHITGVREIPDDKD